MLNESITDLVCQVYQRALGVEQVRPADDFFRDLGGDSLALAEVVSSIYDLLHVDVMETMTTSTTPQSLARFIAERLPRTRGQPRQPPSAEVTTPALVEAARRVHELIDRDVEAAAPV